VLASSIAVVAAVIRAVGEAITVIVFAVVVITSLISENFVGWI
jgi:hypothetical protein